MVIPWEGPFFPTDESRRAAAESLIRILVVDDEPSLTRSVAALLQSKDRLIEDCGSVAETLARLNTRSYDLLIIDYRLPDASGLAVMDWLLSHERRESTIMISGEESMDAAVGALRRSADDFLLKPYSPEQLRRAVTNALLKRQVERNNRIIHQRLQSSEQMHRYMVENSLDLIYTLDAEGRFNYLNQRVESLLGHPRNDLIGKHFSEIVHPEDVDRARFFFAERRTGPRAASNVELRLSRNPYGPEGSDGDGPVSIVLNAMGIYRRADSRAPAHFVGTYGAARNLPALRRRDDDAPRPTSASTTRSPSCPTASSSTTASTWPSPRPSAARASSRSCSSTSTASGRSTKPTAAATATPCSAPSRSGSSNACAAATP
jgi:PAS domain S-box-containing protein